MEKTSKKKRTSSTVKKRYMKKTYRTFRFILRYDVEQDIIDYIEKQPSKNEFIKSCIKEKMNKSCK